MPSPRAQLEELVRHPRRETFGDLHALPVAGEARAAAVLILFGVLDGIPSRRRAAAVPSDLDVLLLARASTLRAHPGQVAFPGGRVDPGDAGPIDAALREAREETGLDPAGVDVLGALDSVPLAYSRHEVTPVLGWWARPTPVHAVDAAESAEVFRAPVADLLDPARRGATVLRRDGVEWRGPAFLLDTARGPRTLWGFTAMVLDGLFDRLAWTEPWDDRREIPLPEPATAERPGPAA
ncbi:8-oxo-dGTP pyrophosphatase MutT (NUDIX family) [Microbacterium sp. SORGH_AS 1204]|uniref:NUDIX hydrolase n=1 Tax=Microbacterium sp. SORGH_AS_1204 TaxID=3041785 RepID=UPI00278DE47B|nr:CoA pyrophosphatase [Microbacterium sp. SORGH_AS_1204]MDQ1137176.1 8-oxo-dGTP pyrophosphatase MutT (NUDIX family) [Microbacterium sp. SORGH_AS_1204]